MVLTPRAAGLAPQVREALDRIRAMLAPPPAFDPLTTSRTITIGLSDYVETLLLPVLLRRLRRAAPSLTLHCVRTPSLFIAPDSQLESGAMEFAIGFFGEAPAPHSGLLSQPLWRESNVCISARRHPRLRGRTLTEAQFLAESHAAVFYRKEGPGLMDNVLAGSGHVRKIGLLVPHFQSLFHLIAASNLIATAPERLAHMYARWLPIAVRPLPVRFPEFHLALVWPGRAHSDPCLAWLRGEVLESSRALESGSS
jgi:DNA-binding transcriptional LysR family regulator